MRIENLNFFLFALKNCIDLISTRKFIIKYEYITIHIQDLWIKWNFHSLDEHSLYELYFIRT